MLILENGNIYLSKGERFPFQCPQCRRYIPFRHCDWLKCIGCGYEGSDEDFSEEVEYRFISVQ